MNAPKIISHAMTLVVVIGSLLCITFAGQVLWWAADRDAPFVMLDYEVSPARPGDSTVMKAVVRRDMSRRCSVLFSRSFFDSKGTRFELTEGAQLMNSTGLDEFNRRSPDSLSFSVVIPPAAQPGVGMVMTVLDYQCNPVHQLYPIAMVLTMNLEVLP